MTQTDREELRDAAGVFAAESMGDFIYSIRESEGKGWDGPRVKRWGEACEIIDRLKKQDKI